MTNNRICISLVYDWCFTFIWPFKSQFLSTHFSTLPCRSLKRHPHLWKWKLLFAQIPFSIVPPHTCGVKKKMTSSTLESCMPLEFIRHLQIRQGKKKRERETKVERSHFQKGVEHNKEIKRWINLSLPFSLWSSGIVIRCPGRRHRRYMAPNTSSIIPHCAEGTQLFKQLSALEINTVFYWGENDQKAIEWAFWVACVRSPQVPFSFPTLHSWKMEKLLSVYYFPPNKLGEIFYSS